MIRSLLRSAGLAMSLVLSCLSVHAFAGELVYLTARHVAETSQLVARSQFDTELAHQRQARGAVVQATNSDLQRDSHGFRQSSAIEHPETITTV